MIHDIINKLLIEHAEGLRDKQKYHGNLLFWLECELEVEQAEANETRAKWLEEQIQIEKAEKEKLDYEYQEIFDYLNIFGVSLDRPQSAKEIAEMFFGDIDRTYIDKLKKSVAQEIRSEYADVDDLLKSIRLLEKEGQTRRALFHE